VLYIHQIHLGLPVCLQYKRGRDIKHITDIKENVVSYYIPLSMIRGYIQHGIFSVNASYDFRFKWDLRHP
jgi:hypothetical protein